MSANLGKLPQKDIRPRSQMLDVHKHDTARNLLVELNHEISYLISAYNKTGNLPQMDTLAKTLALLFNAKELQDAPFPEPEILPSTDCLLEDARAYDTKISDKIMPAELAPALPAAVANTPAVAANTPAVAATTPATIATMPTAVANTPAALANTPATAVYTPAIVANTPAATTLDPADTTLDLAAATLDPASTPAPAPAKDPTAPSTSSTFASAPAKDPAVPSTSSTRAPALIPPAPNISFTTKSASDSTKASTSYTRAPTKDPAPAPDPAPVTDNTAVSTSAVVASDSASDVFNPTAAAPGPAAAALDPAAAVPDPAAAAPNPAAAVPDPDAAAPGPARAPDLVPAAPNTWSTPARAPDLVPAAPNTWSTPARAPDLVPAAPNTWSTPARAPALVPAAPNTWSTPARAPALVPAAPNTWSAPARAPALVPAVPSTWSAPARAPALVPAVPSTWSAPARAPALVPAVPSTSSAPARAPALVPAVPSNSSAPAAAAPDPAATTHINDASPSAALPDVTPAAIQFEKSPSFAPTLCVYNDSNLPDFDFSPKHCPLETPTQTDHVYDSVSLTDENLSTSHNANSTELSVSPFVENIDSDFEQELYDEHFDIADLPNVGFVFMLTGDQPKPFNRHKYKDMPKFTGDSLDWPEFFAQFEESVINTDLEPVYRLSHLREKLDPETQSSIKNYVSSQFNEVVEFLKERFTSAAGIMLHIQEHVKSLPMATENQSFEDTERAVNRLRSVSSLLTLYGLEKSFELEIFRVFTSKIPKRLSDKYVKTLKGAMPSLAVYLSTLDPLLQRLRTEGIYYPDGSIAANREQFDGDYHRNNHRDSARKQFDGASHRNNCRDPDRESHWSHYREHRPTSAGGYDSTPRTPFRRRGSVRTVMNAPTLSADEDQQLDVPVTAESSSSTAEVATISANNSTVPYADPDDDGILPFFADESMGYDSDESYVFMIQLQKDSQPVTFDKETCQL
ncbi:response to interferon-alpha [Tyrophagus putrescentiae]|nr:response to interferon-alpha [Tyrophagus putrescentiae]